MIQLHLQDKPHKRAGQVLLPVLAVIFLAMTGCINSELDESVTPEPQEALSGPVFEQIQQVMRHRQAEEYSEAERLLDELEIKAQSSELNRRETEVVYQLQANTAQAQADYEVALAYYRKLLGLGDLSPRILEQTLDNAGALSYLQEDYRSAIDYFLQLLETDAASGTKRHTHLRIAYSYNELQDFTAAIAHLESARSLGERTENSLQLLQELYLQTGQMEKAAEVADIVAEFKSRISEPGNVINGLEEYRPIATVQPRYPNRALRDRIEGWAQVSFTVDESGNVVDPVVVESSPEGVFDEASLTAVAGFKFRPNEVDGEPVPTPGVRFVFRFSLDN